MIVQMLIYGGFVFVLFAVLAGVAEVWEWANEVERRKAVRANLRKTGVL